MAASDKLGQVGVCYGIHRGCSTFNCWRCCVREAFEGRNHSAMSVKNPSVLEEITEQLEPQNPVVERRPVPLTICTLVRRGQYFGTMATPVVPAVNDLIAFKDMRYMVLERTFYLTKNNTLDMVMLDVMERGR